MRLIKKLSVQQKKQLQQMVFVGRLATEAELSLTFIDSAISFSERSNKITFYIKCLSEVPEEIEAFFEYQNKIFTANTNSQKNIDLLKRMGIDYDRLSYIELKEKLPDLFKDKLIIFRLDPKDTIIWADMEILEANQSLSKYLSLPSPKLRVHETKNDLEHKLVRERRPIMLDYYPGILKPSPELIVYEDCVYQVKLENKSNPTTYFQDEIAEVKYITLTEEEKDYFLEIMYDDQLYFVSVSKYGELKDKIEEHGEVLNEILEDSQNQPKSESKLTEVNEPREEELPVTTSIKNHQTDSEIEFINKFKSIVRHKYRLFHHDEDLINFHTSIKTNPITVLGGMSGTGKSQLARAYADALELSDENIAFIPISPSYQEPHDILGYLNPQTGVYYESDTGLVDLLLKAEADQNNLYMVIFDEMNLSQVEHWFSPFLSLLELEDKRTLNLFHENTRVINGDYKANIQLHDNLIFVGTVNFDETTKSFSDRLLDRINIIVPRKAKFAETIKFYERLNGEKEEFNDVPISRNIMRDAWLYEKRVGLHHFNESEIKILDDIHEIINAADPQMGISFRVALSIINFMTNIPKVNNEPIISRREAFDFQINQRILTKINGVDSFVEPLVGYFQEDTYVGGSLYHLLTSEEAKKVSDFNLSLETLKNKAKELKIYGFAN